MLRIAICDDENTICSQVERYLRESSQKYNIDIETDVFYSGEAFLDSLKNVKYDIVFLDLILGDVSGIDVSRIIRQEIHNDAIQIIYISAVTEHAFPWHLSRFGHALHLAGITEIVTSGSPTISRLCPSCPF